MSSMEPPNEEIQPNPETPVNPAQKQAKRVFIGFAATVTVGLTLAGWYVGGRIFAAEKAHPVAIAKPVSPAAPIATPAPSAPVIAESVEADEIAEPVADSPDGPNVSDAPRAAEPKATAAQPKPADPAPAWNTVDPQSGELYLQLAAMGPNSTNEYLKTLDAKGIHPRIAPGPSESLHRLLIGPYPDRATLEKEQQELEAAGIQFMARRY